MPRAAAPREAAPSPAEARLPPTAAPPVATVAAAPAATAVRPELRFWEPPIMTWVTSPTLKLRRRAARTTGTHVPSRRTTSKRCMKTSVSPSGLYAAIVWTKPDNPSRGNPASDEIIRSMSAATTT